MDELNALQFRKRREQKQSFDQFREVLRLIIFCYKKQIRKGDTISLSEIREKTKAKPENYLKYDLVDHYLKKYKKEFPTLTQLRFVCEAGIFDWEKGREAFIDIAVYSIFVGKAWKLSEDFDDEDYYFSFECKRLENLGKNQLYIKQGIKRYVESSYARAMRFAGMIGFVEKGDIVKIKDDINCRLSEFNKTGELTTVQMLHFFKVEERFTFSYSSRHERVKNSPIDLYHLFLDYTAIIA